MPTASERIRAAREEQAREEVYRALAEDEWGRDGEIEFDAAPVVSISEDQTGEIGAYVQAWVWVANPDATD